MNIDILKNNPAWWWYLLFATLTTLVTFAVWVTFKWSNSVSWNQSLFREMTTNAMTFTAGRLSRNAFPTTNSTTKSTNSTTKQRQGP